MSFQSSSFQQNAFQIDVPDSGTAAAFDDGDSWWGSAGQVAVGVVRGLAVAALSLNVAIAGSFNSQDEIAPAAATSVATDIGSSFRQRSIQDTKFVCWPVQDELPTAAVYDDEGTWPAPRPVVPIQAVAPNVNDELPTRIDEDYWQAPSWLTPKLAYLAQVDDDFVAPPAVTAPLEESEWSVLPRSTPSTQALVVVEDDFTAPKLDEDYWPTFTSLPRLAVAQPTAEDDFVPQPTVTIVDEDYWLTFVVPPKLPSIQPWTDDAFAVATTPEESDWNAQRGPVPALQSTIQSTNDDLPTRVDEDYWWASSWLAPKLSFLKQVDDDFVAPPVGFRPPEEDGPSLPRSADSAKFKVWTEDDQIVPVPITPDVGGGGFLVYGQRARQTTRISYNWANDELPTTVVFHPVEEDCPPLPRSRDSATYIVWAMPDDLLHFCWVPVDTAQTAGWGLVSNTQTPSWAAVTTSQTPNWSDIDDTQC